MTITRTRVSLKATYNAFKVCQMCKAGRITAKVPSHYCDKCRNFIWGGDLPEVAQAFTVMVSSVEIPLVVQGRETECGPLCLNATDISDLCWNCYSDWQINQLAA